MTTLKDHVSAIAKEVAETEKKAYEVATKRIRKVVRAPANRMYKEGVGAARDVVNYNVKAHHGLGDSIAVRITGMEGFPPPAVTLSEKLREVSANLVEANEEFVNNTCDALIKFDPLKSAKTLTSRAGALRDDLLKAIKRTDEKPAKKPASKSRKPAAGKSTAKRTAKKRSTATKPAATKSA